MNTTYSKIKHKQICNSSCFFIKSAKVNSLWKSNIFIWSFIGAMKHRMICGNNIELMLVVSFTSFCSLSAQKNRPKNLLDKNELKICVDYFTKQLSWWFNRFVRLEKIHYSKQTFRFNSKSIMVKIRWIIHSKSTALLFD